MRVKLVKTSFVSANMDKRQTLVCAVAVGSSQSRQKLSIIPGFQGQKRIKTREKTSMMPPPRSLKVKVSMKSNMFGFGGYSQMKS